MSRETLTPSANPHNPVQLELFPSGKLYSCHSDISPKLLSVVTEDGKLRTSIVVQDGYITPHPMLAGNDDPELNRTPNYVRCDTDWLNIKCGYIESAMDKACIDCANRK